MKKPNYLVAVFAIGLVVIVGIACKSLSGLQSSENTAKSNSAPTNVNAASPAKKADSDSKATSPANVEKADFTYTAEDLDKEYTRKGVKSSDLEKFSNKNIAITGRVSMLVLEKKGTTDPWVTLFAPGIGHGVNCYFDDENVAQMKMLKEDKMVKIQGFQDDFIVPEVSPMLKHCAVLEAK